MIRNAKTTTKISTKPKIAETEAPPVEEGPEVVVIPEEVLQVMVEQLVILKLTTIR